MTGLWEVIVKTSTIFVAAWLAARLLRWASADLRHQVWLAALVGAALVSIPFPVPVPEAWFQISAGIPSPGVELPARLGSPLYALWIAGALLSLGRWAAGVGRVAWWTRRARMADTAAGRILFSREIAVPMTWGVFRPAILLPDYAREWPPEKLRLALAHERAHIARRDWLWQTLAQLVASAFWFHPLAWLAAAELRREAERATDDRVLASGVAPADYAAGLVEVARRVSLAPSSAAVTMMTRRSALEDRVRRILDISQHAASCGTSLARFAGASSRTARSAVAMAAAVLVLGLAACHAGVYRISSTPGIVPPRVVHKVEPQYTEQARQAKIAGTVVLHLQIDQQGHAEHIHIARSLDRGLDRQAVDAVRRWTFEPGRLNGKPVRVAATIEVNFRLL
jgi:TonB family protein